MPEESGPEIWMPHSEALEDGIFEIRAKQGTDISRVLYFFFVGSKIVFDKWICEENTKMPKREIELAKSIGKTT